MDKVNTTFLDIYNNFPDVKDTSEFDEFQLKICEFMETPKNEINNIRKLFYVKKFVGAIRSIQ